jgi:hypothetical protein
VLSRQRALIWERSQLQAVAVDKPSPVTGAYLYKQKMNNLQTTYTSAQLGEKAELLTYDELKAMAQKVVVGSSGRGKTKGWFERLMNKLGWYRQSEWYLIDASKFMRWPTYEREFNLDSIKNPSS